MSAKNGSGKSPVIDLASCRQHACIRLPDGFRSPEYSSKTDLADAIVMFCEMGVLEERAARELKSGLNRLPLPELREESSAHGIFEQACTMAELLQGLYEHNAPVSIKRPRSCEQNLQKKNRPA